MHLRTVACGYTTEGVRPEHRHTGECLPRVPRLVSCTLAATEVWLEAWLPGSREEGGTQAADLSQRLGATERLDGYQCGPGLQPARGVSRDERGSEVCAQP